MGVRGSGGSDLRWILGCPPRGDATMKTYVLNATVGFGPFSLPAGQVVVASGQAGSADTRLANIGNRLFAALKLKMLLDYRARQMTFYGDCR